MEPSLAAIEVGGTVDENRQLRLDQELPITGPRRVRVIVLFPAEEEPDEREWLYAAARNPAFASLRDAEEDIYSLSDGKPFDD
ncbi:MAG: hypothetical protein JXB15_18180 [Anaerolineales bacterium]|nr:hypothetical protein [Anaerolineales bacterium]